MSQKSKVKFINREIYPELINWLDEPEIMAIAGPRQSGKTTLLKKLKENLQDKKVVYINFEDSQQLASFQRAPQDFVALQLAKNEKTYFLFDEFQHVSYAGKALKLLFDQFPQAKFIITGSSALKIRQIASFLVGRVIFFNLYPFSFSEYLSAKDELLFALWQKFNQFLKAFLQNKKTVAPALLFEKRLQGFFEEYLIFGGYPAVSLSTLDKKKKRLAGLIETYIEKDIVKFLQIGDFLEFRNFSSLLATRTGNLVNFSSLMSDARLNYRQAKKFLGGLEKTFVIKLLTPFFTNKTTEIKKSPKIYFLDLGLRNALISDFREVDLRPDKGVLAENFALQNLYYRQETNQLNFWRTKQGAEVDFVLNFQNEIIPLEVKYQPWEKPKISRSLQSFLTHYQPKKAIVLNRNICQLKQFKQTKILFLPLYFL